MMLPFFSMSNLWNIHTVVFDLDDTLYAERDYVLSGFAAVDEWLRSEQKLTGFLQLSHQRFKQGHRGRIFDEVLLELRGENPTQDLVKDLIAVYRQHRPTLELFPDAEEVLEWSGNLFNLGLITDGYREVQENKIAALALGNRIPFRVVTDSLGREFWKPHQEPYRRVMQHFGGDASGFVYIGDNPRKDFIGARQLGWRTIRIRRDLGEHQDFEPTVTQQADRDIIDLNELKGMLSSCRV